MKRSVQSEVLVKPLFQELSARLDTAQAGLQGELNQLRRGQEKQSLSLARIEAKLEEREKAADELRGRVHALEGSDRKRLFTLGKLAGLGGVAGATVIKLLSHLGL